MEKLSKKAEELTTEFKIKTHPIVKAGVIFDEIREVAHEHKLKKSLLSWELMVVKEFKKLTRSWALKVMASSKVPFLVVQDKPKKKNFEKIVFPVDFRRENKEKVNWVNYLAKHFNSKFMLFKRHVSDHGFKKRIISNMVYAENILKNNNVEYEIASAKGNGSFEKETVEYAKSVEADLILVLVTRDISFIDYLMAAKEQYIISNPENIPVMCINPKPAKLASGFRATGG